MNVLHQALRTRPRLALALALGVACAVSYPAALALLTRVLIGWNTTVWSYLALISWMLLRSTHTQVRQRAAQEDRSAVVILAILSLAAVVSLLAIGLELVSARELALSHRLAHYAFTAATVFGSWCLVAVLFTLHYARMYYQSPGDARALRFPEGGDCPDYWDFLYFSFTIAVAAQTSDVSVMSRPMRKAVLAQSVLSFIFNAAIIGLSINIAASLIGA